MPSPELSGADRRALRTQGQLREVTVIVGHHGVTPSVVQELDRQLDGNQLVKVRATETDRRARQALFAALATATDAALVGSVGRTAVLYRPGDGK